METFCTDQVLTETQVVRMVNQFAQDKKLCDRFLHEDVTPEINTQKGVPLHHQWKQLEAHPGYYICNHGTVISTRRRRLQQLKPYANTKAKTMIVSFGKTSKNLKKLVLETFDPHFKEYGGCIVFDLERWDNPSLKHLNYVSFSKTSTTDADSSLKMGDDRHH
jgi:hypothetical protein